MEAECNYCGQEQPLQAVTVALHGQNYPCGWQEWPLGKQVVTEAERCQEGGFGSDRMKMTTVEVFKDLWMERHDLLGQL